MNGPLGGALEFVVTLWPAGALVLAGYLIRDMQCRYQERRQNRAQSHSHFRPLKQSRKERGSGKTLGPNGRQDRH